VDWHSPREWLLVIARSTKRIAVLVAGLVLVVAGVVMLVLPGPGLLVIIAGLAVLATEFAWAEHLLDRAQAQASRAAQKAKQRWRGRRRNPSGGDGATD
jgi:uncharacterized protein (TIGR02611 family)